MGGCVGELWLSLAAGVGKSGARGPPRSSSFPDPCHWRRETRNQPTILKKRIARNQRTNFLTRAVYVLQLTQRLLLPRRDRRQRCQTRHHTSALSPVRMRNPISMASIGSSVSPSTSRGLGREGLMEPFRDGTFAEQKRTQTSPRCRRWPLCAVSVCVESTARSGSSAGTRARRSQSHRDEAAGYSGTRLMSTILL